jgi:hypothetical protein
MVSNKVSEDTMNAYISDRLAREHADRLMADAAAFRRARRVRQSRRAVRRAVPAESPADRSPAVRRGPAAAFHTWLAAGQL